MHGTDNSTWEWCLRTNGTYVNCPIEDHEFENVVLAVYNPSSID